MFSRITSSVSKEDVFPRLIYCDSRCFQTCHRCPDACRRYSQACRWGSLVLIDAPKVLSGTQRCSQTDHNHSHGTPVPVIRDLSYSKDWLECPPRVRFTPEIDASKFSLHIPSDCSGGSQRLKYILLMCLREYSTSLWMILLAFFMLIL